MGWSIFIDCIVSTITSRKEETKNFTIFLKFHEIRCRRGNCFVCFFFSIFIILVSTGVEHCFYLHVNGLQKIIEVPTLFLFVFLRSHAGDSPLLQFLRRYETRGTGRVVLPRLPPVMIVLAYYLQYVAGLEGDTGLCAWYKLVLERIVVELGANEYLRQDRTSVSRK